MTEIKEYTTVSERFYILEHRSSTEMMDPLKDRVHNPYIICRQPIY